MAFERAVDPHVALYPTARLQMLRDLYFGEWAMRTHRLGLQLWTLYFADGEEYPHSRVNALCDDLSACGGALLCGFDDGSICAWRLHDRRPLCHYQREPAPIVCLAPADGSLYVGTSRADLLCYPAMWSVFEPVAPLDEGEPHPTHASMGAVNAAAAPEVAAPPPPPL